MVWNADGYHSSYTMLGIDVRAVRRLGRLQPLGWWAGAR